MKRTPADSSKTSGPGEDTAQFRVVDRRHFTQDTAGAEISGPVEEKPRYPTFVEELLERTARTEKRYAERMQQVGEELAKTKARLEAEYERKFASGKTGLLIPFLEVLDNLERAVEAARSSGSCADLIEGVEMTAALFRARLRLHAVEPIEIMGLPFDPNVSQAVGVVPVTDRNQDGVVVEEVLRGYRMAETLIRPAQVRVGRYAGEQASAGSES